MYNPKLERRPSGRHGWGCFTRARLAVGEVVWASDPGEERFYVHRDVVEQWPAERRAAFYRHAYQVARDVYFDCTDQQTTSEGPTNSINHSCAPNTWWDGDHQMVARRDIAAGEEITYDYATGHTDADYGFDCACGEAECRGRVTGNDHRDPVLQRRYAGHWLAYIVASFGAPQR